MLAIMLSSSNASRFLLVVLLLSVPMQDPLCFSAQSGQSLIPDPGVNAGSFSVPVSHLPGPEIFLSFLSSCVYYITFMVKGLLLLTAIFLTR